MDTHVIDTATRDGEHLRLLSIFHYIVAAITAVFALIPVIHLIIGIAMVSGSMDHGPNPPPGWFGWLFIAIATLLITCGLVMAACMAYAGRCLARRQRHLFCLVVAAVSCLFMPMGTVLGVFTLIVLMRPSVQALFTDP